MTEAQKEAVSGVVEAVCQLDSAPTAWATAVDYVEGIENGALWALAAAMAVVLKTEDIDLYFARRVAASVLADLVVSRNEADLAEVRDVIAEFKDHADPKIRQILAEPALIPKCQIEGITQFLGLLDTQYEVSKRH